MHPLNWQDILKIMLDTHQEFLPNSPADHEQSELYMYMAKRISKVEPLNVDEWINLADQFVEFSVGTFKNASAMSSLEKLHEEIKEVAHEIKHGHKDLAEEYADCIMCIFDSAIRMDITPEKLKEAFAKKLEINKNRVWVRNENNTYSHKKGHKLPIGLALLKTKQVSKPPTDEDYVPF